MRDGAEAACRSRTDNFADLVRGRPSILEEQRFEIALEFSLPEDVRAMMPETRPYTIFRYELVISPNTETGRLQLEQEAGTLLLGSNHKVRQLPMFPAPLDSTNTIVQPTARGRRTVFRKSEYGRSRFNAETVEDTGSVNWNPGVVLNPDRSALSILPDYDEHFPSSTSAQVFLREKVISLAMNSQQMRRASPPGLGEELRHDGSNLPWVADELLQHYPVKSQWWMGHMTAALAGFKSVRVVDRPDDRHKYFMLKYENGLEVPSWKASDGTLRFMALTLLANLPKATGLYMIEEPENGIHPGAMEELFYSLSSVYDAQVLLATHSPEIVAVSKIEHLRIFGKTSTGEIDITSGENHPHLKDWQSSVSLGSFFASGILA